MIPCIPLIPSMRPRSRKQATSWAFCEECETLYVGVCAMEVVCPHPQPDYSLTWKTIRLLTASRLVDSGWRYESEPA